MYSYPSAAYVAQPPAITYGSGFHGRPSSRPPAGGRSQDNHHGHSHDENSHEHGHSPPNPSDSKGDHREHRYGRSQDHGHSHDSLSHDHFHEHPGKPSHGHAHEHSQSADSFPSTFTFPPSRKSNGYALPAARSHSHNDRFSSHLQSHSITIPEDTGPHSHSHSYSQPNGHSHSHSSSHSHSHSQIHHDDSILCTSPKKEPWTLSTISTPLLISLTYLLTEYASKHHHATHSSPPAADSPLDSVQSQRSSTTSTNLLSSFSLVAGILLLSSLYHRFKCIQQRDDSGGGANGRLGVDDKSRRFMPAKHRERVTIPKMAELGCGLLLPYFAALELGGVKTALFSLAALVGGVSGALRTRGGWRRLLGSQRGIAGILCTWIAWEGITAAEGGIHAVMIAYIALLASTLFFGSPFASPVIAPTAQEHDWRFKLSAATAGAMFIPPLFYWMFFVASLDPDPRGPVEAQSMFFWWWLLAVVVGWSGVTFANVKAGSIIGNVPFAIGAMAAIVGDLMLKVGEQSFWALADKCVLVGAVLGGIYLDAISANSDHHEHGHSNDHALASKKGMAPSHITRLLVSASQPVPLLHSILIDRNSRRIFYFMCLNFTFMIIQTVYGILTSSLGLLSDSIHMLFDCLALLLGLFAAVMSKYPPSARFPYGLGKMDTLAGFANGVFLMLISVEIVLEAIERLVEPVEMKRIGELLIVSSLGLAVNLVGIWAFDHAHHHPGHSHGHSHSHGDDGGHGHSENMHGIFLHILADTLGSVAVVISTLLVQHFGWPGFDPLASVFIAVMIFVSAIPLVLSSAGGLLLTLPSNTEYNLREILSGINGLRGVVGCCVPRFWTDEVVGEEADGTDADAGGEEKIKVRVMGVVHVQVAREVGDLDDVRVRVEKYLAEGLEKGGVGVDVLVQVERVGEGGGGAGCWCGGGGGAGGGGGSASSLGCQNGNGALMGGNGNNGSLDPAPIGLGLRGPVEGPDMDSKAK
ncbi:cation efflux protein [Terfezia boudieri ATCC MYA-4762]|uniref:Zinc transporter n=1 Tax=Terfezia boudieri ATCC MYA-4762 TaxID=1051890 RepID=A0A3N4LHJ0_9PEZI|nr:cation efflux protein [Terfezia boudieri ATCC MYA-4762]